MKDTQPQTELQRFRDYVAEHAPFLSHCFEWDPLDAEVNEWSESYLIDVCGRRVAKWAQNQPGVEHATIADFISDIWHHEIHQPDFHLFQSAKVLDEQSRKIIVAWFLSPIWPTKWVDGDLVFNMESDTNA